jgi:hypothetical protein
VALAALGVVACGGDDGDDNGNGQNTPTQQEFTDDRDGLETPEPVADTANRSPRPGGPAYNAPPPPIAASVTSAATAAKCEARGFKSEAQPQSHVSTEAAARESNPPLSGAHNQRWADYGFYNEPIPYKYHLHNLEHGSVFIHYGREVPVEGVNALRQTWAKSPAYIVAAPNTDPKFPVDGVVVGAPQRWLVCKPFAPAMIPAVEAFIAEYRGRGPEGVAALNSPQPRPDDLPEPELPDPAAAG